MPDFENDDFPLFLRQFRQATHRRPFRRRFPRGSFKPSQRFPFPRQAAPQGTVMIHRPVPETPHTIVFRFGRGEIQVHQCQKRLLQHILRLAVA